MLYLRLSIPTLDMKFDVVINDRGMAAARRLFQLERPLPRPPILHIGVDGWRICWGGPMNAVGWISVE